MQYLKIRHLIARLRWIAHPITIFVSLQLVWLAITLIWVLWFVSQQEAISELARKFGQEFFDSRVSLTILVVGCVLLGVLCVGLILLFVFGQKQSSLARQQRNFVSSVTHELKSPLASLQLSFETIVHRNPDQQTTSRLYQMILWDIERLKRLVDQILVTGRFERGIVPNEEWKPIYLPEFLSEIAPMFEHLDPEILKRVSFANSLPALNLPRGVFSLIIGNLLENAIKYSKKGTPITIGADLKGQFIRLYVRDLGFGLDHQDRRRIFKMFHRGHQAIKKSIPGTGLGLYIVKEAVKSLGGEIWVQSPGINLGSTFYISIPLKKEVS
jgi:signal transduction histidine kinase